MIAILKDQQSLHVEYERIKQLENEYGSVPLALNAFPITQARFAQQNIPFTLTDKYKAAAKALARQRVALAGARLGNLLNQELK